MPYSTHQLILTTHGNSNAVKALALTRALVLNGTQHVLMRLTIPTVLSPNAMIRRMIPSRVHIVKMRRPSHSVADVVCPSSYRCEVTFGIVG